jgi:predicted AlkP superfamily pyrophosphatase or phosphodiesterase
VTGLYPENHGIVSNTMLDPVFNEVFTLSNGQAQEGVWYEGEPIWVTAELQGLPTATYFWPGSDAEIKDVRPTEYHTYDGSVPYAARTQQILDWLGYPAATRPRFMTLYFSATDTQGHINGPSGQALSDAIATVDAEIGKLLDGISAMGMNDLVDIMVVSDHGMSQLSRDSMIFLDDYIDMNEVNVVNYSPVADIVPDNGLDDAIYEALADAHPKMNVYKKGELPADWHYGDHRRIQPIICVAEEGWSISTRNYFNDNPYAFQGGAHGYAPEHPNMWGIFLAKGPSFKSGVEVASFKSLDLYELMCKILELTPAQNDGSADRLGEVLK